MENQIEENLQQIIAQFGKTDSTSIALTIASTVLAIVAIVISVFTAAKQNQIALYDKRYSVFEKLTHIFNSVDGIAKLDGLPRFSNNLEKVDDAEDFRIAFMTIYIGETQNGTNILLRLLNILQSDRELLAQSKYLFDKDIYCEIDKLSNVLNEFMMKLFKGGILKDQLMSDKKIFSDSVNLIKDAIMSKVEKSLCLTWRNK